MEWQYAAERGGYPTPGGFGLTEGDSGHGGCWHPAAMSGVITAPRKDGRFAGGKACQHH